MLSSLNWSFAEVLYEARKDLFSFLTIGITFWLAERALASAGQTQLQADASQTAGKQAVACAEAQRPLNSRSVRQPPR